MQSIKIDPSSNSLFSVYVSRLDVWISHELSEAYLIERISTSGSFKKHERSNPFLKRMVTNDKKWIVFLQQRRAQKIRRSSATNRHKSFRSQGFVRGFALNWKSVVFYELLPRNRTFNSDMYCA